jgi:uncharacterized protein (TIGR04222 family)
MDRERSQLWQKIRDFELDDPSSSLTFTERLARENDWSLGFADRVVQEYKRFIYLAATASHQVTPSDAVDQAWHLHLIYTRSYWEDLCRGVLGRPIHHGPTKGGRSETARFSDQYKETLASYREAFGDEPPSDIWPQGASKSGRKPRHKRVNVAEAWVIAKPWPALAKFFRRATSGMFVCVAPLLLALVNPFDLRGAEFLVLFPCIIGIAAIVALFLRYSLRPNEDSSNGELTPYQVACLADGIPGVVRAAIVSVVDRKVIEIGGLKTGGLGVRDYRLKNLHDLPRGAEELEQRILAASNTSDGCHLGEALKAAEPAAEKIHHRLQAWGLLMPTDTITASQLIPFLIMLGATFFGVVKIMVGISREKPVGFLIAMVVVSAVISVLFLMRTRRTRAGDDVLKQMRQQQQPLISSPGEPSRLSGDGLIMAAALFGLPAIAAGELAIIPDAWKYRNGPPTTGGGSGCGSSGGSGCGGGGGGGCGGGGCGGCGSS